MDPKKKRKQALNHHLLVSGKQTFYFLKKPLRMETQQVQIDLNFN